MVSVTSSIFDHQTPTQPIVLVTVSICGPFVLGFLGLGYLRMQVWIVACVMTREIVKFIWNDGLYDGKSLTTIDLQLQAFVYSHAGVTLLNWGCSTEPKVSVIDRVAFGYSFAAWRNSLAVVLITSLTLYKLASNLHVNHVTLRRADLFSSRVANLICNLIWQSPLLALKTVLSDYVTIKEGRSSAEETYQHTSLKKGEIRLLKVHRRFPFSTLQTTAIQTTLEQAPSYEAISYTWGAASNLRQIYVNDQPYFTSTATYDAIYSRSSMWRSRIIWIDYLCINQQNLQEKAAQVMRMTEIYSNACKVMVCLGQPEGSFRVSFIIHQLLSLDETNWTVRQLKEKFKSRAESYRDDFATFLCHPWFTRVWVIQEVAVARNVQVIYGWMSYEWADFAKLVDIFSSPQMSVWLGSSRIGMRGRSNLLKLKLIHAARSAHQRCHEVGSLSRTSGSAFSSDRAHNSGEPSNDVNAVQEIYGPQANREEIDDGDDGEQEVKEKKEDKSNLAPSGCMLLDEVNLYDQQREKMSLPYLLGTYARFRATNPRDKVYALRGLVLDKEDVLAKLRPDYAGLTEDLYLHIARAVWSGSDPLIWVSFAGIGHGSSLSLPSWVPDWSMASQPSRLTRPLPKYIWIPSSTKATVSTPTTWGEASFAAGGLAGPQVSFDTTCSIEVAIDGIFVDEVDRTVSLTLDDIADASETNTMIDSSYNTGYDEVQWKPFVTWHEECLALAERTLKYQSPEELIDQFSRTIIFDSTDYRQPAPASMLDDYLIFATELTKLKDVFFHGRDSEWIADDEYPKTRGRVLSFSRLVYAESRERRFYGTRGGHIGLGPRGSRAGDVVFIARGATTPWLLRRTSEQEPGHAGASGPDKYSLVGDCYVHGMMYGEKWDPTLTRPIHLV